MTDILCRWLNEEVNVSKFVDQQNFAKEFATGYLLGEVLYKHGLQNDFQSFSQSTTADSKLNNFTRLEPTLKLLEVPYDTNVARAVMNESHGAITRLMYQMFIALGNKTKRNLTGVAMETMRPSGPVKLESIESGLYKERLKQLTKRQVDLNFESLIQKYQAKQKEQEEMAFKARFEEEEKMRKYQQAQRQRGLEKSRQAKKKQEDLINKIKEATVKIPKPPESLRRSAKSRSDLRRQREIEEVKTSIDAFEASMKAVIPPVSPIGLEGDTGGRDQTISVEPVLAPIPSKKTVTTRNDEYINKIRTRLEEDTVARKEREKRRRRVLVEQLKAHEAQEAAHREEMLVNRLMRQSQQERRIAVQLLQIRHEKEIIRQNRVSREKQYSERRLKDFDDALTREAEMCRQSKIDFAEETRNAKELHDALMAARAKAKYIKHYNICSEILSQMVDFSCKVGEYRELTEKLIPPKLFREWKSLFVGGIPLFEDGSSELLDPDARRQKEIEEEKANVLDEGDFMEYKNLIGEWLPPEGSEFTGPPKDNAVLGHIIQRLFNIVFPPEPPPPPPEFPPFPIKVCLLGKIFSGKTTISLRLVQNHRLVHLSVDELVAQAIEAHKNGEAVNVNEPEEEKAVEGAPVIHYDKQNPEDSRRLPTQDNVVEEGQEIRESPKENEDANKLVEKQASVTLESEEKRDKTKEELEREAESKSKSPTKQKEPQPTVRAKLGAKAYGYLKKGKATPDQLLVEIMVEAIRQVPEGTGWLMDGFPSTINQAKLLEKSLSGYDATKEGKEPTKLLKEGGKGGRKKSKLVPDPHPYPEAAAPKSGIDVVILFDLRDEIVLHRSEGRTYNPVTGEEYHQENNPPVEGCYTGINKQEKIVPVTDPSNDREQVQQRVTGFLDAWPKLDKWFTKFGILQNVNANKLQDDLYEEVAALLNDTYMKLTAPPQEAQSDVLTAQPTKNGEEGPKPPQTETSSVEGAILSPSEAPSEAGLKPAKSEKATVKSKGESKAGSKPGSPKGIKKGGKSDRSASPPKKGTKSRSPSPRSKKGSGSGSRSPSPSKKGSRPGSRGSRPGSRRARSPKKSQEEVEIEKPPEIQGPPEPEPGSEDWEYSEHPIEKDFAVVMSRQWESIENTYISTSKLVFRTIRNERELIYRYFYGTRVEFVKFLKRPDEKQEYVIQWQTTYNDVAEDMRSDEETKSELHQQVDDLCDRLHDICDSRKELAEKERQAVMTEGWLEDRLGILTNHYITLMQVEVDRYQDTIRMLRDYYSDKVPGEPIPEYARLPLVELPLCVRPQTPTSMSRSDSVVAADKLELKTPSAKREKDKIPKTPETGGEAQEEEQKSRIPLVPRRPKSGETAGKGKEKKAAGKKQADDKPETPIPPSDLDEKLVFDAYIVALGIIDTLNILIKASLDQADRDQEAEAQRQLEQEKEKEREALAKKAKEKKGGKGRKSPGKSPSKMMETPPPPPPEKNESPSEEEQQKKKLKEKTRKEFLAAVAAEDQGLKTRLEMIKVHACSVLQELKSKAEETYQEMDNWLGERFLQEIESIKDMSVRVRYAIEREEKLQEEQLLEDKDFVVDLDTYTFKTPTPPPPQKPVEVPLPDSFTISQLLNLYTQFSESAPSGVISIRAFSDTIMEFTALAHGMELLPDAWMNVTTQQLQEVCSMISPDSEYINWRKFLLSAAQPWPSASKMDLLLTLDRFLSVDTGKRGYVDSAQFNEVELWFTGEPWVENTDDPDLPPVFDRQGKLPMMFFQVLADQRTNPPVLDYVDMLMYFSMHPDPMEGFLRALSVVTRQALPSSESLANLSNLDADNHATGIDIPVPDVKVPNMVSPTPEMSSLVSLDDLMMVFHHGESKLGDSHRLSVTEDPNDTFSRTRLAGIFLELGAEENEAMPFHILYQHPIMQDCMLMCQRYKSVDLKTFIKTSSLESCE